MRGGGAANSGAVVKRVTTFAEFQRLTDTRLAEAKLLLRGGHWDGAYYLAGYAVECAFKVILTTQLTSLGGVPDRGDVSSFYQHNLAELRNLAGLESAMTSDPSLKQSWIVITQWSERTRYEFDKTQQQAEDLLTAIEKVVLPWIKIHW